MVKNIIKIFSASFPIIDYEIYTHPRGIIFTLIPQIEKQLDRKYALHNTNYNRGMGVIPISPFPCSPTYRGCTVLILSYLENKQESEDLGRLIESLATAWSLIGEEVKNNGRLREDEALNKQEITPATSLAYLLASSTGEGVLITSLTHYLVLVHNSFVHAYRDRVNGYISILSCILYSIYRIPSLIQTVQYRWELIQTVPIRELFKLVK